MPRTNIFKMANVGLALAVGWHYGTELFFVTEKMLAVSRSEAVSTFVLGALVFVLMNGSASVIIELGSKLGDKK